MLSLCLPGISCEKVQLPKYAPPSIQGSVAKTGLPSCTMMVALPIVSKPSFMPGSPASFQNRYTPVYRRLCCDRSSRRSRWSYCRTLVTHGVQAAAAWADLSTSIGSATLTYRPSMETEGSTMAAIRDLIPSCRHQSSSIGRASEQRSECIQKASSLPRSGQSNHSAAPEHAPAHELLNGERQVREREQQQVALRIH